MTRRAGLDQQTVISSAAQLADSAGLEELSLATLAIQLGVRTPSLYNHVAGLPALRRELALLGMRELAARLGHAVMGKAGDDAIWALSDAYRVFGTEHPGLYAATLRAPAPDDAQLNAASKEVVEVVLRALSYYELHGDEALHTVRGLRSAIHGFVSLEAVGGFGLPLDLDESYRRLIRMFIGSLQGVSSP